MRFFKKKIAECDLQINKFLKQQINADASKKLSTTVKTYKRQNKNVLKSIDLNHAAFQYFDLNS